MSSTKLSYPADPALPNDEAESPDATEQDDVESSLQQLKSLAASLVAEAGMARLSEEEWADLKACRRTRWQRGSWKISSPERPESPEQIVTLEWLPGSMLLAESYAPDAPTLTLPLPAVRGAWQWRVPPARSLPPPPRERHQWDSTEDTQKRDQAEATRRAAWQRHLAPILQAVEAQRDGEPTPAKKDEGKVAVEAMRLIQARRLDPTAAERTLAEDLEEFAAPMRA